MPLFFTLTIAGILVGVYVLYFNGYEVFVAAERQHVVVIVKVSLCKTRTYLAGRAPNGRIEDIRFEIPIGSGQAKHLAQLSTPENADFLSGRKHYAKVGDRR